MPRAWRIVKAAYAREAFSGEGAFRYGGRWNSPGTRVVYTSESLALAVLEILVHLPARVSAVYSSIEVVFADAAVEQLQTEALPDDWRDKPSPRATLAIGDTWAREMRSAVLSVPSAIVPGERNFLLNPLHADFGTFGMGEPKPFHFDPRLRPETMPGAGT